MYKFWYKKAHEMYVTNKWNDNSARNREESWDKVNKQTTVFSKRCGVIGNTAKTNFFQLRGLEER